MPRDFVVSTECALIRKLAKNKNIPLWDFTRLHDECLAYVNSLKNGYCDCSVKVYDDLREFIDRWKGGLGFTSNGVQEALKFSKSQLAELLEFINSPSKAQLSDMLMLDILEDRSLRNTRGVLDTLVRKFANSTYRHIDIPLTLEAWTQMELTDLEKELVLLEQLGALSHEEALSRFLFSPEDMFFVTGLFENCKNKDFASALKEVASNLRTHGEEIAYLSVIMSFFNAYISNIDLEAYWCNVFEASKVWRIEYAMATNGVLTDKIDDCDTVQQIAGA